MTSIARRGVEMADPANGIAERLAAADSAFPRLSHGGALAVIADLAFPAVDVCVFTNTHTHPDAVRGHPDALAAEVRARLERHRLAVSDVFMILAEQSFEDHA